MNPFIYIIPITVILVIFVIGFAVARKKAVAYPAAVTQKEGAFSVPSARNLEHKDRIYEAQGVNQISNHPLGAVQRVIRGRIRFIPFGMMMIGIALFGLYILYFTDREFFVPREPLYMLVATVLLAGAVGWGVQLFYFATCRIKLRRRGFEMCSILGARGYTYKDASFHLFETIEHKNQHDGYRPVIMKTQNFNWIWVCQIFIESEHRLIEVKSSRYAWLPDKMMDLTAALVWVD